MDLRAGRTDGRPGRPGSKSPPGDPGPPVRDTYRHGRAKLEAAGELAGERSPSAPSLPARALALLLLVSVAGCSLAGRGARERYDNARALASTLERPAAGSPEDRTYRNGRYRGASFAAVRVSEPRIEAAASRDPEYQEFLSALRDTITAGTIHALASVERLGPVNPADPPAGGAGLVCETRALVHVTPTGAPVGRDPVFRDPRPKLIVVYSLEDAATREVVFRYTSVGVSHWEYGPWAMEDLRVRALEIASELAEALRRE